MGLFSLGSKTFGGGRAPSLPTEHAAKISLPHIWRFENGRFENAGREGNGKFTTPDIAAVKKTAAVTQTLFA